MCLFAGGDCVISSSKKVLRAVVVSIGGRGRSWGDLEGGVRQWVGSGHSYTLVMRLLEDNPTNYASKSLDLKPKDTRMLLNLC